jgi:hypothetical protein
MTDVYNQCSLGGECFAPTAVAYEGVVYTVDTIDALHRIHPELFGDEP